ncbi:MAG: hypothetical protein WCC78_07720, partial [Terriglobales bacterium]
ISIVALLVLVIGLWIWNVVIPSASLVGAFLIAQLILLLLLAARFWQRAVAVSFYTAATVEVPVETRPAPVTLITAAEAPPAGGI